MYFCIKCGITSSLIFFFSWAESFSSSPRSTLTFVYNNGQKRNENEIKLTAVDSRKSLPFMGLESAASRSLVSSSSSKHTGSSSSAVFDFLEDFVAALGLDFEVGPSDGRAAATSFKVVV